MKNFSNVFMNEKHVLRLSSVTFYSFCKKLTNSHYIRRHKPSELQILMWLQKFAKYIHQKKKKKKKKNCKIQKVLNFAYFNPKKFISILVKM